MVTATKATAAFSYSLFPYPAFSLSPDEKKFRLLEAAEVHPKSKDSEKTTTSLGGDGNGTEITPCTYCKKSWAAEQQQQQQQPRQSASTSTNSAGATTSSSSSSTTTTPKVEGECCCSAKHRALTPHEQTVLQVRGSKTADMILFILCVVY